MWIKLEKSNSLRSLNRRNAMVVNRNSFVKNYFTDENAQL